MFLVRSRRSPLSTQMRHAFIAAAAVAFVLLVGQMFYSGQSADRISLDRQKTTALTEIRELFTDIKHDQTSVTIWDDAVRSTAIRFDFTWIWENIGTWMNEHYGTDRVYIVDGSDRVAYTFVEQGHGEVGGTLPSTISPMVVEVRDLLATDAVPEEIQVGGVVNVGGHPSFVSVAPIVPSTARLPVPENPTLHVSVQYLDDAFASIGSDHLFKNAHFATDNDNLSFAYVPVAGSGGFFAWTPHRPGMDIILANLPLLAAAATGMLVFLLYLGKELGRMSSDLQAGQTEALRLAREDHLTGLPNRLALSETMETRLRMRIPTAAIYVDIDNFKNVNDALGHPAGDELIRIVAERLKTLIDGRGFVARIGGDEFAVLTDVTGVSTFAEAIVACIRPLTNIDGFDIPITASVGYACTSQDADTSTELVRRADIALYQAKSSGRDCFRAFDPSMDDDARHKRMMERDLRAAMAATDQLHLAFQPLYSGSGAVVGVETLVRWRHPSLGDLPPPVFIKIAEDSGLIAQLGEWILEQACRHAVDWDVSYIAVNVSALQFRAPGFVQLVADILRRTGLKPERLELELTENLLAEQSTTECVAELRAMGISIALDDFGTGFSSLNYLRQFPVDKIKIDRSFVQQATSDSGAYAIVVAMVRLANALGLEITAEGVETEEQRQMLIDLGCHQLQGYLMSRPVAPDTFSAMLGVDRRNAA